MFALAQALDEAGKLDSPNRPLAHADGAAGDVYLCHPFLIHAAQPHRGTAPRLMAQPSLEPVGPFELDRAAGAYSPVERAVRRALGADQAGSPTIASPADRARRRAP